MAPGSGQGCGHQGERGCPGEESGLRGGAGTHLPRAWLMGLACLQHTMPTPTTPDPEDNCIIHDLTGHSAAQQRTCKYI